MFLLQTFLFFVLSLLYSAYCLPVALWLFMVNCTLLRFHQQTLLVLGLMKLVFGEIFVWQEHLTVLLKSFVFLIYLMMLFSTKSFSFALMNLFKLFCVDSQVESEK